MTRLISAGRAAILTVALTHAGIGMAQSTDDASSDILTGSESNPNKLDWMQGFPPADDKVVRFTDPDYFAFPKLRWTVCHFRELMPTSDVPRNPDSYRPLERMPDEGLDAVTFTPWGGNATMTWGDAFDANYSDGVVVLHHGRIVYERYNGCLDEAGLHGAMSMTKSLTGLLGESLVAEEALDEDALVATLIPELEGSAFGNATVRQVMDMTTSLDYSEDYADPNADVWVYAEAGSPLPKPADYAGPRSYFEFLETVRPEPDGEHGVTFGYKTVNADALGWLIARTTDKSVADVLAERVWKRIGAERDAFYTVDSIGTPFAGGGFNAALRDMARVGQLMLDEGQIDGEQIVPVSAVDSLRGGGDKEAFARSGHDELEGWSYRGMWWITHNEHGAYAARGVHGQTIYVDPTADMVIARYASHPVAANAANDPTSLPAYQAVAEYLMAQPEPRTLTGGKWVIEDIAGAGVINNAWASLGFLANGRVSGSGTCNRLIGNYDLSGEQTPDGGALAFGSLGSTLMACPEALENQERKLLDALERVVRFDIDDTGALLLSTGDGDVVTARRH